MNPGQLLAGLVVSVVYLLVVLHIIYGEEDL